MLSITEAWALLGNFRYDLATSQTITDGLGLRWQNDCLLMDVTYQRSFILSDEVDREGISAELKNGVLRLTLPKAERARTRRIEIKSQ